MDVTVQGITLALWQHQCNQCYGISIALTLQRCYNGLAILSSLVLAMASALWSLDSSVIASQQKYNTSQHRWTQQHQCQHHHPIDA